MPSEQRFQYRHTQLLSWAAKAFFGVCNAAYFDDVDITEPSYCGSTGKHVIHKLAELAGTPFASEKDTPFATARVFLGVMSDLSDFKSGSVEMRPKPGRVGKIVSCLREVIRSDKFPSGLCSTVCGKVEYSTSSGASGRCGRAPLSALRMWQHRKGPLVTTTTLYRDESHPFEFMSSRRMRSGVFSQDRETDLTHELYPY
jgi:hypothetical protein